MYGTIVGATGRRNNYGDDSPVYR